MRLFHIYCLRGNRSQETIFFYFFTMKKFFIQSDHIKWQRFPRFIWNLQIFETKKMWIIFWVISKFCILEKPVEFIRKGFLISLEKKMFSKSIFLGQNSENNPLVNFFEINCWTNRDQNSHLFSSKILIRGESSLKIIIQYSPSQN